MKPVCKRAALAACLLGAALTLGGCGSYPSAAADGTPWNEDWSILGKVLGVEDAPAGFALLDNNIALATDDTWFATWTDGTASPYTNADGDEVDLYPAQLYLLAQGCADDAEAQNTVADWIEREEENYTVLAQAEKDFNGQTFTVLTCEPKADTNPYARTAVGFTAFGGYAITAEASCVEGYGGDMDEVLTAFLNSVHYSADLAG